MGRVIGIDLGTTNSCVATIENGAFTVIPNGEGSRTTSSVILITEDQEVLVGQLAKRQAVTNPENTVHAVKRLMGRRYDSAEVKSLSENVAYTVVRSENDDAWVQIRERDYSPAELSAMILRQMKNVACEYLGEETLDAVITVPAYFDDSQRQATRNAGKIAGLNVLRIINEPTAAALAYGITDSKSQKLAVYDLGGGTFDVSILELSGGVFEVKSTCGDTFLGGEDFDNRILRYFLRTFQEREGIDLSGDKRAMQRLREGAEKAKHELSSLMETEINLPFIHADSDGPKHLSLTLKRRELEELVDDLIQKTLAPCQQALKDSGFGVGEIDQVLMVGGMTRMPRVQELVCDFFQRKPNLGLSPDEVVAIGAATQGAILQGDIQEVLLLDVTPLSLGVETMGGVFTKIIDRNTPIPCRESQVFSTAQDNQSLVNVHVLQGERPMAKDNQSLARFQLVGIPAAPRGVPQIEVTFGIDANGIVNVSAKDLGSGKEQRVEVVVSGGLSDEEVERLLDEAQSSKDADRMKKEVAELRNNASGLIYTTERSLVEFSSWLSEADEKSVRDALVECNHTLDGNDPDAIREAVRVLESHSYKIAEAMYAQMGSES